MAFTDVLDDALIVLTAWSHVVLTPYTKVEESFNLHATHDVLMYGLDVESIRNYDHFVFPGAVPRSFLGSIILAGCSLPVIHLLKSTDYISSKADLQIIVRLVLATLNALGLCILRRAVSKRFGNSTSSFFALISYTQFHLPFWMGRTLPNMFALLPVNIAYACILSRQPNSTRPSSGSILTALSLLTFTAVVFRAEIALLLAPLTLHALLSRWVSLKDLVKRCLIVAGFSVSLTTLVDSYLWSRYPLWPELHSIYFNVYQNKSSEWGTSPFHAYFSTHLPKLLLSSLPLSILGSIVEPRIRGLMIDSALFVLGMSFLAHKEWRFVVYVVPLVNVAAARGAYWLMRQRTRSIVGRLSLLVVLTCLAGNALVTYIMTQASMANYPGGVALMQLNEMYANSTEDVHVHISNLAAQTGASLFLQTHAPPYPTFLPSLSSSGHNVNWIYNKTENLTPAGVTASSHFTHAIVEASDISFYDNANENVMGTETFTTDSWDLVKCVSAFDGFRIVKGAAGRLQVRNDTELLVGEGGGIWESIPRLKIVYSDKLCILSRRRDRH